MLTKRLLCTCLLSVGLGTAWADSVPFADPDIAIDVGSDSAPIQPGTTSFALTNGGGVFGFYNPFSTFITKLVFDTTLLTGLPGNLFNCQSNQFFQNCAAQYTSSTGDLTITFSGVNPEEAPADPTDPETGEFEGIPPLLPGCAGTPDAAGCVNVGHFLISLNNNFSFDQSNPNGGWAPFADSEGGIDFNTQISTAPEPSEMFLTGAGCWLAIGSKLRRRTKRS